MMQLDVALPGQLSLALTPDLVLFGGAMLLMLWAAWRRESASHQRAVGRASIALSLLVAAIVVVFAIRGVTASPGVIAVDNFRWTADLVFLLATVIAIAMAMDFNTREGITVAETHVLLLFATGGMMLLAAARDLMIVFLGIEVMSIAVYVLAGIDRRSARGAEGALKYFLLGAFSTAFLLYGIALIYGATGSTNLAVISERVATRHLGGTPMLLIGIALLLVGFGFKVAAAPFHMWAPDVYDGSTTPVTAYMAAAVKAAAFAAFLRVWLEAFASEFTSWHSAVWWIAALTMVVGNVIALQQKNLKRMLAYSSIAHTGFILVGLAAGTPAGSSAFLFYLFAYTLATMGAFAVIATVSPPGDERAHVDQYAGLWTVRPWLASAMAIFMLALLGFPVFGGMGFFAKWYVLQAALQAPAPQTRLAVILVLATVVSAGYYLYVVMVMFMRERPADAAPPAAAGGLTRVVIAVAAILLLVFGVYPDPVARLTRASSTGRSPATTVQRTGATPAR